MNYKERWLSHLKNIYPEDVAESTADRMEARFHSYENLSDQDTRKDFSEADSILITYGDTLQREGETGLQTLTRFLREEVGDSVSAVHLLPICPYSSDDGFSVIDYKEVDPKLGTWNEVHDLSHSYDLVLDAVINHVSRESSWFKAFLRDEAPYNHYFITADPSADYRSVTRPRALPLLTCVDTRAGSQYVWTTFSADQIDLNYADPDVLIDVLDVLLFYAQNGARYIRLDAIGFIWKKLGTTCMHLPQAHEIVKLIRSVLAHYFPDTKILTETNVPFQDNISYFGSGDEAHMIYQFTLPPLVLYSLLTGDGTSLTEWARALPPAPKGCAYFNFLSSHDGIGVRPVEGILHKDQVQTLIDATLRHGGEVSWKDNGDGTKSPYELNINYQDALASPYESDEIRIAKFLAAETILLSMQGIPGIYIHSLLGSRNDYYGKTISGIPRRINREKLNADELIEALHDPASSRSLIFHEMKKRLQIRKAHPAFSPYASQLVRQLDPSLFAFDRHDPDTGETIHVLINLSAHSVTVPQFLSAGQELLSGRSDLTCTMGPYETRWVLAVDHQNKLSLEA